MIIKNLHFAVIPIVAGCATVTVISHLSFSSNDVPEREGVEIIYNNASKQPMCLSPSEWPNSYGKFNHASNRVWLKVDEEIYPVEDYNSGSCISGCSVHVAPGAELRGFIPYTEFKLPKSKWQKSKTLIFSPQPYECRLRTR